METTLEKITAGTIRIENGKLTGLGICNNDTIDVESFDQLLNDVNKADMVEVLSNTISGIGQVLAYFATNSAKYPDVLEEIISPMLPTSNEIYNLNLIRKVFSK